MNYKSIELNEKYKGNGQVFFKELIEVFVHKLPQLLFVSLPLLALLLHLLYLRHKDYYYVSHGIFSIHLYIFTFIVLLVSMFIGKINSGLDWSLFTGIRAILILLIFFYLYKAMRNFYRQSRIKTIMKYILVNTLFLIVMGLLFMVFLFLSLFSV